MSMRLLTLLLVATVAGCGGSGLDLAPVAGVVTLDGQPVSEAGIMFQPVNSSMGPPAYGATDENGRFELITVNQPGAAIGEHRVAISKTESIAIPQRRGLPIYKTKEHIPSKYGNYETSGLTITVEDDDNSFKFDLTSG
jgi:hypothetical protein